MSGGNSSKGGGGGGSRSGGGSVSGLGGSGGARRGGWEEAGGEFYQESYPGGGASGGGSGVPTENIATLLPSKYHRTVRRIRPGVERRQSTAARGTATRDVLVSMLPDLSENLSNEESTWEEIMQIKAMPVPMAQKRELKAQLQSATKLRLQGLEQFKWRRRKAWQGTKERIKETLYKLELWKYSFKTIEGNFGTGVVAYFLLIRWLLFLNLSISALIFFFVTLPNILYIDQGSVVYLDQGNEVCNMTANSSDCCHQYQTSEQNLGFVDVIQGTGWMERTYLFYGIYANASFEYYISGSEKTRMTYDLSLAYILIAIVYFLLSIVAIVRSAAKGFKERLVEGEGQFYQYCNLIFGGWDFCIHNEKSANIKHKALYNEIKGCLEEKRLEDERQSRSKEEQVKLFILRFFINALVICILCAAGLAIFYAFNFSQDSLDSLNVSGVQVQSNNTNITYELTPDPSAMQLLASRLNLYGFIKDPTIDSPLLVQIFFLQYFPSLCIILLNIIVPTLFQYLIEYENYSPGFVVKLTLIRTVFLRLSSLGVLLSHLYMVIDERKLTKCLNQQQQCWETYVGQQFYKLLITDFVVQILVTFLVNFPRAFVARHTERKLIRMFGEQEFHLPKHVLDVVYSQTLCWLGAFYCPLLPMLASVFFFFVFYIKKFSCLVNSKPSSTVYRASRSNSLFMIVLLLSFCVAIIPVGYAVTEIEPSISCGPFNSLSTVWEKIVTTVNTFPSFLQEFVFMLGTYFFTVPAFVVLIMLWYYYWMVADANRHMVAVLKSQLVLEGHDKQFLLNRLSAFIRQQQKRNEKAKQHHAHTNVDDGDGAIRQSSR